METSELLCEVRPTTPKGARHQVRREGRVPGVLYGPKTTPMAVSVNAIDLTNRVAHAASRASCGSNRQPPNSTVSTCC